MSKDKQKNNIRQRLSYKIIMPIILIVALSQGAALWLVISDISKYIEQSEFDKLRALGQEIVVSIKNYLSFIDNSKELMMDKYKSELKDVVSAALSVQQYYYDQYKQGAFTEEEQKRRALQALAAIRYGENGYVFALNSEGIMMQHPNVSYVGKNFYNQQDSSGKYFIQEMIRVQKNDGGFVRYEWTKPGDSSGKKYPKLSYQAYFAKWDLIIGTGVYIDDVDKNLNLLEQKYWSKIRDALLSIKLGESSYPVVVRGDNLVILYIDKQLEGKKVEFRDKKTGQPLLPLFKSHIEDIVAYHWIKDDKLVTKYAYVGYVYEKDWYVLLTVYKDEIFQPLYSAALWTTVVMSSGAVALIIFIFFTLRRIIIKPVKEIEMFATEVGKGNLRASIEYQSDDELGNLTKEIENMRDGLKEVINSISHATENISATDREITEVSNDVEKISKLLSESIEDITQKSESVQAQIEETTSSQEEVQSAAQMVANVADDLANNAISLSELANTGKTELETVLENVQQTVEEQQVAKEKLSELAQLSKDIQEIVETINSIAEQTNLLALNAQIEQARAGEAGKGFAVVADEIRKLQEESKSSTDKISTILGKIESAAQTSNEIISKLADMTVETDQSSKSAAQSFDNILQHIEQISNLQHNLAQNAEESSAASQEISSAMQNAQQNTAVLNEAINTLNEEGKTLTRAQDKLVKELNRLTSLIDTLQKAVDRFQV